MWWNPALEDQAFDRAHRFGQTRDVNIYKLTIENTVEERILTLQNSKRALAVRLGLPLITNITDSGSPTFHLPL